ncbi:MAG: hypothetical protein QXN15_10895 [Candidatus Jordarchaeales archaeon]|nr:hypothetical protein [Candidatus Jordarchaeia archaeon]
MEHCPGGATTFILVGTRGRTFTGGVNNAGANAGLIGLAKHYAKAPLEMR